MMAAANSPPAKSIALFVVLLTLATGAVILRAVSARIRKQPWQAHDLLCFISLLSCIGYVVDIIIGTVYGGIGIHITQLQLAEDVIALKVFFASEFFWSTGVACFRLSILLLYIQIFQRPAFFRTAVTTATVVALYYIACILTVCLLCRPINYNWDKTIKGSCASTDAVEVFSAAFTMALDVWVVCLPLPIVWRLHMSKQRKIGISTTFALGLIIASINLGRLIQTTKCNEKDFTYCLLGSSMLVAAEMSTGVIVACVPTLGPILSPGRFDPSSKSKYRYKDSRLTTSHKDSSGRTGGRGPASDVSDERPFRVFEDSGIERDGSSEITGDYQVHARHNHITKQPEDHIDANEIRVVKDFRVFGTQKFEPSH